MKNLVDVDETRRWVEDDEFEGRGLHGKEDTSSPIFRNFLFITEFRQVSMGSVLRSKVIKEPSVSKVSFFFY